MIRTVWLGLSFLIILAGVGSFRFAFGHFGYANASSIVRVDGERLVDARTVQDTLTITDQSPVAYVSAAPMEATASAERGQVDLL